MPATAACTGKPNPEKITSGKLQAFRPLNKDEANCSDPTQAVWYVPVFNRESEAHRLRARLFVANAKGGDLSLDRDYAVQEVSVYHPATLEVVVPMGGYRNLQITDATFTSKPSPERLLFDNPCDNPPLSVNDVIAALSGPECRSVDGRPGYAAWSVKLHNQASSQTAGGVRTVTVLQDGASKGQLNLRPDVIEKFRITVDPGGSAAIAVTVQIPGGLGAGGAAFPRVTNRCT
jgi:hypothetical protein